MGVETIDVQSIKKQQEDAKQAAKLEEKKTKSIKVKVSKRPVNSTNHVPQQNTSASTEAELMGEYKNTVPVILVEAFSRGLPQFAPANEERLRKRLLRSHDLGVLMEKVFMNYEVESDKLKLLMTLGYHGANEIMETLLSSTPVVASQQTSTPHPPKSDFDLTPKPLPSSS